MSDVNERLLEIDTLRAFTMIIMVLGHCLAIYAGFWPKPEGDFNVPFFFGAAHVLRSFRLPLLVFISGYLFAFALLEKKKSIDLKSLIVSKTHRLLIPGFVFNMIYIFVLGDFRSLYTCKGVLHFLSGESHLSFLPLLFWCFIFSYYIYTNKSWNEKVVIGILIVLNLLTFNIISLGVLPALYYLFYFQMAFGVYKYRNYFYQKAISRKFLIFAILTFVVSTPLTMSVASIRTFGQETIIQKLACSWAEHCLYLVPSVLGILVCYLLAVRFSHLGEFAVTQKIAVCGMGIYLFHSFFIEYIYYHTEWPKSLGPIALPLVTFIVSSMLSWSITWLMIKNRYLKKLVV